MLMSPMFRQEPDGIFEAKKKKTHNADVGGE